MRTLIAAAFAAVCSCPAGALDCSGPHDAREAAACLGGPLTQAATSLLQHAYAKSLAEASSPVREALAASQVRWMKARDAYLDRVLEHEDMHDAEMAAEVVIRAGWLSGMTSDAGAETPVARGERQRRATAPWTGGAFAGYAIHCAIDPTPSIAAAPAYRCGGDMTLQNESRLCRSRIEWEGGKPVEYEIVGEVVNGHPKAVAVRHGGQRNWEFAAHATFRLPSEALVFRIEKAKLDIDVAPSSANALPIPGWLVDCLDEPARPWPRRGGDG